jgi:hypothetical protein
MRERSYSGGCSVPYFAWLQVRMQALPLHSGAPPQSVPKSNMAAGFFGVV